jgi:hypothetical protein
MYHNSSNRKSITGEWLKRSGRLHAKGIFHADSYVPYSSLIRFLLLGICRLRWALDVVLQVLIRIAQFVFEVNCACV